MNLLKESYRRLFPNKDFLYQTEMEYNRRLSDFNANIQLHKNKIILHLNLQWKDIDPEIKIGLIQHLILKIFKKKNKTTHNIELYNNFIKKIPILTKKTKSHPVLEQSFRRINQNFFYNQLEQPNLEWGTNSIRKLASYNFHNDTVTISTIFKETKENILDYLMYHELLHKQQKFQHKNGRSYYHTRKFRKAENLYPDKTQIDKEINQIIKHYRKKKTWMKSTIRL